MCATTAGRLAVSVRQIKRLKKRKREDWPGAAANVGPKVRMASPHPLQNLLLEQPKKGDVIAT